MVWQVGVTHRWVIRGHVGVLSHWSLICRVKFGAWFRSRRSIERANQ
jgi:hypothetical protein